MAVSSRVNFGVLAIAATLIFAVVAAAPAVLADSSSIAPAPGPVSDGTTIDQGIAYVLMLVALVLTYLIHAADFSL